MGEKKAFVYCGAFIVVLYRRLDAQRCYFFLLLHDDTYHTYYTLSMDIRLVRMDLNSLAVLTRKAI